MEYLSLGKVIDAFGLDGTLKIYSTTNNGKLRYQSGNEVYLYNPNDKSETKYTVLSYRHNGLFDFVLLDNISTPEDALSKKGYEIHVVKNNKDIGLGNYFYSDLKGCKIVDNLNNNLGIVKEIEEFPAQLTLRISRTNKPDFFVPFIEAFIDKVDIENKTIVINVIEGLLWLLKF